VKVSVKLSQQPMTCGYLGVKRQSWAHRLRHQSVIHYVVPRRRVLWVAPSQAAANQTVPSLRNSAEPVQRQPTTMQRCWGIGVAAARLDGTNLLLSISNSNIHSKTNHRHHHHHRHHRPLVFDSSTIIWFHFNMPSAQLGLGGWWFGLVVVCWPRST